MNIYSVIAMALLIILVGNFFGLEPAIQQFAQRIADIPTFQNKGSNPALYELAVRIAYLIAIVGIFRVIFNSRRGRGDE